MAKIEKKTEKFFIQTTSFSTIQPPTHSLQATFKWCTWLRRWRHYCHHHYYPRPGSAWRWGDYFLRSMRVITDLREDKRDKKKKGKVEPAVKPVQLSWPSQTLSFNKAPENVSVSANNKRKIKQKERLVGDEQ